MVDDVAVPHHGSGLGQQGRLQQGSALWRRHQGVCQGGEPRGVQSRFQHIGQSTGALQRGTQRHQFTGTHLAQCNASTDALHITQAFQGGAQIAPHACTMFALQCGNRIQALLRQTAFTRRLQQPAFEQATAHAGHAGVHQREERGAVFTAQGLREFQVAPCGGGQINAFFVAFHPHLLNMREAAPLGVFGVTQQGRCSGVGLRQVLRLPSGEAGSLQLRE